MIMQGINNAMKPVRQSEAQSVITEGKRQWTIFHVGLLGMFEKITSEQTL